MNIVSDIAKFTQLKCKLVDLEATKNLSNYDYQPSALIARYDEVMSKWYDLRHKSDEWRIRLRSAFKVCKTKNLQKQFAIRVERVHSFFAAISEGLSRPRASKSLDELTKLRNSMMDMKQSLEALRKFNEQLIHLDALGNPHTDITVASLENSWEKLMKLINGCQYEGNQQSISCETKGHPLKFWLFRLLAFSK